MPLFRVSLFLSMKYSLTKTSMSKYLWLIDAGHGGMKDDKYTTAPAKMHTFEDGFCIMEGLINRGVAQKLYRKLSEGCVDWALVYDDKLDTSLQTRVNIINKVYETHRNAISVSIHSNAGGGKGFEVFTSPGKTRADPVAEIFCLKCIELFKEDFTFRTDLEDGDHDKEAKFFMLTKTRCPSILVESLFFDNRTEAEYLSSEEGQEAIAEWLYQSILEVEKQKPI